LSKSTQNLSIFKPKNSPYTLRNNGRIKDLGVKKAGFGSGTLENLSILTGVYDPDLQGSVLICPSKIRIQERKMTPKNLIHFRYYCIFFMFLEEFRLAYYVTWKP